MIYCPYCDCENIEGTDSCDHCGQPLSDLHLPIPATSFERSLLRDRLAKVPPHRPVTTVSPDATIGEVLQLMADRAIGCVVVTEDERLVGIFSERDVVLKIGTEIADLAERPVSEFMTRDPQALASNSKVAFALHRMAVGHYRHVPIVDEQQRPVAIISVRDVLGYLTERLDQSNAI